MMFRDFIDYIPGNQKRKNWDGDWHVRCPVSRHGDGEQREKFSLHVTRGSDRILLYCFGGCTVEEITRALDLRPDDLFYSTPWPRSNGHLSPNPARNEAPAREPIPTLVAFSQVKKIPHSMLEDEGWRDGPTGITIPYRQRDGSPWRLRLRSSLQPGTGFRWDAQHDRPLIPFGRHRLDDASDKGELLLVEGESDSISAWLHAVPCLGIPGASAVKALEHEDLRGIEQLWIVQEPGRGGETFVSGLAARLRDLAYKGRAHVLRLGEGMKDLSALHCADPERFLSALRLAQDAAQDLATWTDPKAAAPDDASADRFVAGVEDRTKRPRTAKPFSTPISLAQLAAAPPREPAWLVENLILEAANGWIGAGPKVGKSYLALDLLLACCLGVPWLGHFRVARPLTVVLVEEEDSAWRVYQRAMRLCAGRGVPMPESFYVHIRTGLQLDDAATLDPFLRWLDARRVGRVDLIAWDVFNKLHTKSERDPAQMLPILKRVDQIRDEFACANLINHHDRKQTASGPDLASGGHKLRGPSEFWGWAENSLYLSPLKGRGAIQVEPESKDAQIEPFKAHLEDLAEGARRWVYDGVVQARADQGAKTRQALLDALAVGPADAAALAQQVGKSERTVKSHLSALEKDGAVDSTAEPGRSHRRRWMLMPEPDKETTK